MTGLGGGAVASSDLARTVSPGVRQAKRLRVRLEREQARHATRGRQRSSLKRPNKREGGLQWPYVFLKFPLASAGITLG